VPARWLVLSSLLIAACGAAPERHASSPRPDVVVVTLDTVRSDHLPLFDPLRDTMPFLIELARGGVVFERAWAPSSWTAPSTASLFTGLYPSQHGVDVGVWLYERLRSEGSTVRLARIPDAIETLPEAMRALGYRTFGVADNPNIDRAEGFARGFDLFESHDYAGAETVNAALRAWRDQIRSAEPSFVYLHYMDAHWPYHPRPGYARHPGSDDPERLERAAYDGELRYLDAKLREAFSLLEVDDDTLVIVVADHGEELYERGHGPEHRQHGFQLYSELTHVLLLVRQPGVQLRRTRVAHDTSLVDVLPTLRDALAAPADPKAAGRSLLPYYLSGHSDPADASTRALFSMRREVSGGDRRLLAVIAGGFKYLRTTGPGRAAALREELYDLHSDPGERVDLHARKPETSARLFERWREFERRAPSWQATHQSEPIDEQEAQRLRSLGYADDAAE